MATAECIGPALPQIPWEERPRGSSEVVWRSQRNPILTREAVPGANSIFNSAVVPFQGRFAGVFRCDNTAREMQLHAGLSADGIHWEIEVERIRFQCEDEEIDRTRPYLLHPREIYECVGDVPNVVFPCAALVDPPTRRIAIYYGGADTVTCLAFACGDELLEFIRENSL